jgi:hypothetical protein
MNMTCKYIRLAALTVLLSACFTFIGCQNAAEKEDIKADFLKMLLIKTADAPSTGIICGQITVQQTEDTPVISNLYVTEYDL